MFGTSMRILNLMSQVTLRPMQVKANIVSVPEYAQNRPFIVIHVT